MVVVANEAPWESVSADQQLFVLITGANSGIGLATGQRLIDEFLTSRPRSHHLILLPTARDASKCLETVSFLRAHALRTATTNPIFERTLRGPNGEDYDPLRDAVSRVHVVSVGLDLCDLRAIETLGDRLCRGTIGNPPGLDGEYLQQVRIPKLDAVLFNAAYGNWLGVDYSCAIWQIFTAGLVQAVTWPAFKNPLPTSIVNKQSRLNYPPKPDLGEVFCACVFGHYILAHQLLPLLSRSTENGSVPGRIIWSSSIEATGCVFDIADIQCFDERHPYESAKRLTDILILTYLLPAIRPYSTPWLTPDDANVRTTQPVPPKVYLTHPGVVASTLFPVPWFLFWAYRLALLVARWLGSPWHCVDSYRGAKVASWMILEQQETLDEMHAEKFKLGSGTDFGGRSIVKKTEVEGYGWEGKPRRADVSEDAEESEVGVLRKKIGRKSGAVDTTEEDIIAFEELGAACWRELEELRHEWAALISGKE